MEFYEIVIFLVCKAFLFFVHSIRIASGDDRFKDELILQEVVSLVRSTGLDHVSSTALPMCITESSWGPDSGDHIPVKP